MALTSEEQALRQALNDIAIGQPEAPVDRITGVRRRHARRRMMQAAGAALAAVAVIAGVVVVRAAVFTGAQVTPAHRDVPSWALPWPDHRDGSVSQVVLDRAVDAWLAQSGFNAHTGVHTEVDLTPDAITWYAGGRVADGGAVIAVFEIDHRLVAGWATADEVIHGQPATSRDGTSPWVLYDVPAPPPSYRGFIGLNVHAPDATGGFPANWVVLLSRPDTTRVFVSGQHWTPMRNGYAVLDTGQLTFGPLEASAQLTNGLYIGGYVGVPGAPKSKVPQLAAVRPLTYPGQILVGMGGQGDSASAEDAADGQATRLYLRCRGQGRVRVILSHSLDAPARSDFAVSRPCDEAQYAVDVPAVHVHQLYLQVHSSPYSAWQVAVVARH